MTLEQQGKDIFVCHRLREERDRLGLAQQEVAEAADVSIKTVGRWEKQIAIPSNKLTSLGHLGVDVAYVLTGVRSPHPRSSLSEQENELIIDYRDLTEEQQGFIRQTVAALAAANQVKSK